MPRTLGQILVDQECVTLAKHFLREVIGATAEDEADMAESIQALCESICSDIEGRYYARANQVTND